MGIFLRIHNFLKLSFCIILLMKQKIFLGVSSASWGEGVNICAAIFWVLLETLWIFFSGGGRGLIFVGT